MLWIFDSWSGGLTFLMEMRKIHPEFSYLYLGDYPNCPYGEKTPEEIRSLTEQWVKRLFDAGATLVILACNTASAHALRYLQATLPAHQKVLWVTIPWAEKVIELGKKSVKVFATEQTVQSRTYRERMNILDIDLHVEEIALSGDLVRAIEAHLPVQHCHTIEDLHTLESSFIQRDRCVIQWIPLVRDYFSPYISAWDETVILGCTHYSYLRQAISMMYPELTVVDPSCESAHKLDIYIKKHSIQIACDRKVVFL